MLVLLLHTVEVVRHILDWSATRGHVQDPLVAAEAKCEQVPCPCSMDDIDSQLVPVGVQLSPGMHGLGDIPTPGMNVVARTAGRWPPRFSQTRWPVSSRLRKKREPHAEQSQGQGRRLTHASPMVMICEAEIPVSQVQGHRRAAFSVSNQIQVDTATTVIKPHRGNVGRVEVRPSGRSGPGLVGAEET